MNCRGRLIDQLDKLDLREGIGAGLIVLGAIVLAWK
jgi:hypothetical protein